MARELGLDRKPVRRILTQERPVLYERAVSRPTKLAPYLSYLQQQARVVDYNAYRLFLELRAQGKTGGYEVVKRAVRPFRGKRDQLAEVTLRFERVADYQAQVDWGSTWAQLGENPVRAHLFVMVLGYSRRLYVKCTQGETLGTLLACQLWSPDIRSIRRRHGVVYLVAILDWFARDVLAWELSSTLKSDFWISALDRALVHAQREMFNSDQGGQFTGTAFTERLKMHGMRISMEGRGLALDTSFVERLWRSLKYEEVCLHDGPSVPEAIRRLGAYLTFYNSERLHQALNDQTSEAVYSEPD
jgi:transposase InsO family protein